MHSKGFSLTRSAQILTLRSGLHDFGRVRMRRASEGEEKSDPVDMSQSMP
jgi:hypothetical protein